MERNYIKRNYPWFLFLAVFFGMNACKKDHPTPPTPPEDTMSIHRLSDEDSLKYYVWWINESDSANIPLYYWNDLVPSDFNPLAPGFANADSVLGGSKGIASYSLVDGKKVDRFSFLDRTGEVSGELQGGVSGDFGFQVAAVYDEAPPSTKIGIYVTYVYKDSPAGKAGVQKGWKIASYNGTSTSNLTDQSNLGGISDAIYSNPSTTFTFLPPDSSKPTASIDLTRTSYHINPVLFDSVYTVNNEKVGYFVYNSFINVGSDENGVVAKQEIADAFSKFKSAGVKELIVDLRYNGGGSVTSAQYLDNLMAPASANGQEMFKYLYNDPLTSYFNSSSDLKQEFIAPTNFELDPDNLNLSRVFFIVSGNTYSASELTINNLKPYMDVYLIGDTTGGKPVGFFTIPISFVTKDSGYAHVADMYAINFRSVNKNGEGDYYFGMAPDFVYKSFNVSNWGDAARDARLNAALSYIETGSFKRLTGINRKVHPGEQYRMMRKNKIKRSQPFNGMIDFHRSLEFKRHLH